MLMLVAGEERPALDGKRFEVSNPYRGEVVGELPDAGPRDVELTTKSARAAVLGWATTPVYERADILLHFASKVRQQSDGLALLLARENGKLLHHAKAEISGCARLFEAYSGEARRLHGVAIPGDVQRGHEHDIIFTRREPFGVVAAITPFNFPISLFSHKVAPALATGNVVIAKPSEYAPLTVMAIARLLQEAGLPSGVLQVLSGTGPELGRALVGDPEVDLITFTGSTEVGLQVATQAARRLAQVRLELGGNDPMIVYPDANLDDAVSHAVFSRTLENGQCCAATKRFIVHSRVLPDFVERLQASLAPLNVGDQLLETTKIGPLIHTTAAQRCASQVSAARSQGAELVFGDGAPDGACMSPVILRGVAKTADVARNEEIFAPVFPVVPFATQDEAVEIANSSHYGLHASVFSENYRLGLSTARRLESGLVAFNGSGLYKPDAIAFGGYKKSGMGREGLAAMSESFTQTKNVALRDVYQ